LDELLSNRKVYFSLYKRTDGFLEVDQSFLKHLRAQSQTVFKDLSDLLSPQAKTPLAHFKKKLRIARSTWPGGLALNQMNDILLGGGVHGIFEVARAAVARLSIEKGLQHALVIYKSKKAGISPEQRLVTTEGTRTKVVEVTCVSSIVSELDRAWNCFPPFFVYLRPKHGSPAISHPILSELRERLGALLVETLATTLHQLPPRSRRGSRRTRT
jgi:hypothetical protein